MRSRTSPLRCGLVLLISIVCGFSSPAEPVSGLLEPGASIVINGHAATLSKLEQLPFVESGYTKRFQFDSASNPKLSKLRERYKLDGVVAPGKDEFERQLFLMDWTHRQFKKFGKPSANAKGALEILAAIDGGHQFFCAQYAELLVSAAASLGWVDRALALRRHQGLNNLAAQLNIPSPRYGPTSIPNG